MDLTRRQLIGGAGALALAGVPAAASPTTVAGAPSWAQLCAYRHWLELEARRLAAEMFPEAGPAAYGFVPEVTAVRRWASPRR